jgi:hypothetical protein
MERMFYLENSYPLSAVFTLAKLRVLMDRFKVSRKYLGIIYIGEVYTMANFALSYWISLNILFCIFKTQ